LTFGVVKRLSNVGMRLPHRIGAFEGLPWNLHAVALAMLVVVVFALAVLQYRWIDQVSEAQEARATSRMRENLRLVTDAFDAEITRAVLAFTVPPAARETMHDRLDQAWVTWNHEAPWPRIVSGLWYLKGDNNGWHPRSWGAEGTLDPRSILPDDDLVPSGRRGDVVHLEVHGRALFADGRPCFLWPLPVFSAPPESPRLDRVLICYDFRYLTDTFLPRLLEKYSTAEDRNHYLFHLGPRGTVVSGTVFTADQFHYRPDCLMPVAGGEPSLSVGGFRRTSDAVPSRGLQFSTRPEVSDNASLTSILHADGACQARPPVDSGLMQISVRRPPDAFSDLFTGFRRRNVVVSGVVMMSLLAGLIALVVSTERARRLARLQTVVAAGFSHELRSPLASLLVAADHLKNGHVENAQQARRYGEIIDAQSRRLQHVVDQVLALTRFNQANGVSQDHAVSVSETIHAGCDGLAAQARQAGIEIERQIASDMPLVYVDPDVLLRCLTNLIENSIKYAASGGWIRVSAHGALHAGRPTLEVTVEDRGPGIEDDETMAVFEPFFRGSSARRSRQPGSGLGLSIVKSAVDAYGGWMILERAVPHGCRFRLFVPTADDLAAVDSAGSKEPLDAIRSHTPDRR
jgi:signal transduction histidine kinase